MPGAVTINRKMPLSGSLAGGGCKVNHCYARIQAMLITVGIEEAPLQPSDMAFFKSS
jgi:hypothetical protein